MQIFSILLEAPISNKEKTFEGIIKMPNKLRNVFDENSKHKQTHIHLCECGDEMINKSICKISAA